MAGIVGLDVQSRWNRDHWPGAVFEDAPDRVVVTFLGLEMEPRLLPHEDQVVPLCLQFNLLVWHAHVFQDLARNARLRAPETELRQEQLDFASGARDTAPARHRERRLRSIAARFAGWSVRPRPPARPAGPPSCAPGRFRLRSRYGCSLIRPAQPRCCSAWRPSQQCSGLPPLGRHCNSSGNRRWIDAPGEFPGGPIWSESAPVANSHARDQPNLNTYSTRPRSTFPGPTKTPRAARLPGELAGLQQIWKASRSRKSTRTIERQQCQSPLRSAATTRMPLRRPRVLTTSSVAGTVMLRRGAMQIPESSFGCSSVLVSVPSTAKPLSTSGEAL